MVDYDKRTFSFLPNHIGLKLYSEGALCMVDYDKKTFSFLNLDIKDAKFGLSWVRLVRLIWPKYSEPCSK